MAFTLRCRSSAGVANLRDLPQTITFAELKQIISQQTGIPPSHLKVKSGFPPKDLICEEDATVFKGGVLQNGDTITCEQSSIPIPPIVAVASPLPSSSEQETKPNPMEAEPTDKPPVSTSHNKVSKPAPKQVRVEEPAILTDGFAIRRVIPDDNSCLFNAVGYVLEGRSRTAASQLRKLIADVVEADPHTFTEAYLEQPNAEYCKWILHPKHWGGAIELAILSDHYQTEIAAFDVKTGRMDCYGQNRGWKQRVYLVYDGIHYDAVGLNPLEDGPDEFDTTVFSPRDEYVRSQVAALVSRARAKGQFTDTASFSLLCLDCKQVLIGEKGAAEHAMKTGHSNFTETKK